MRSVLLVAGVVLPLLSSPTYVYSIWKGRSKPQRTTRFLLMVATGLSFGALLAGHDTSGVWLALVSFIETVIIWLLSLRRGMGGRGRLDMFCVALCGLGLVLWMLSGQSLVGLLLSIVADCIACIPSLVKTIRLPHTETPLFFAMGSCAGVCILLAGPFTWRAALFPAYIALINAVYVGVICWPRATPAYDVSPE